LEEKEKRKRELFLLRAKDVRCFCYVLKLKLNVEDNVFGVRDATESSRDSSRCGHQHAHRGCLALSD
jgi:hypothetical protein